MLPNTLLHAVLLRLEIPHNTGAIRQTCVTLGCDLVLGRNPQGEFMSLHGVAE